MPREQSQLFVVKKNKDPKAKYPYYIHAYVLGKRQRYYFRTEKAAKQEANERNAEITSVGSNDQLPHSLRIQAFEASRRLEPFGKTISDATEFYIRHLERLKSSISFSELEKRVNTEIERRMNHGEISERHAETATYVLRKLKARFGDRLIKTLEGSELKAWITGLPLTAKTRNRILGYSRSVFALAKEWGLLDVNPLADVSGFRQRKNGDAEIQVLTVQELKALFKNADSRLIPYIAIGGFAGLRDAELKRLDWKEILWGKKLIEVTASKSKTAQRRLVTISDNLFAWLEPYRQSTGPIIPVSAAPGYLGKPSEKLVYELRKAARRKAGMSKWKPNSLRHSFCSYHYAMYEDAGKTAAQAGHTSPATTFAHYRELVTSEDAKKYWNILPS
jgi:integrase